MATAALHKFAPASELGPAEDYPPGSVEWAERISNRLQISAQSVNQHTVHHLCNTIKAIWRVHPHPWEIWPIPPFYTPNDYCNAVTGHSWEFLTQVVAEFGGDITPEEMQAELARAQAEHRTQGTRTDLLVADGNRLKKGSNQVAYLLRRLAREQPDLLTAYERGEFKSARAAAIAAGIVKPPTALGQLRKAWSRATPDERTSFLDEVR